MSTALIHQFSLLGEARMDSHLEPISIDDGATGLAEHLFASKLHFLDRAVVELVQLALKRYNNVFFTVLLIDSLQLSLMSGIHGRALNERVRTAEEPFEDLIVIALVCVAIKLVLALGNSVLKTVLAVLVVDTFHERVG